MNFIQQKEAKGTSLVVQWLRMNSPSNAGDEGLIPAQGTKGLSQ